MEKRKLLMIILSLVLGLVAPAQADDLLQSFESPPDSSRPGVYWYFMDGNQDRDEMTADLEAMAQAGIGSVLYLEVNIGVPRGPVDFMSEKWQDNFAHAVKTTERLGMEFILGTGPGWAGSGGPWIQPEQSMQHLVGEAIEVEGPQAIEEVLPVPAPLSPNSYSGMSQEHAELRNQWYDDVAVLAYPAPEQDVAMISDSDLKTLKETLPFSIRHTETRFVNMPGAYDEVPATQILDPDAMIDLTDKMQSDGTLQWEVPPGKWKIYRFVARSTGQTTRPAPAPGHGFENDKFNADAFRHQWDNYQAKLLEKVEPGKDGIGWTRVHLDSWEMSSQNWSAAFQQEFLERRGYDPKPFYPAFNGFVVESLEKTERFLWDMRKTAQELTIENYVEVIKKIAHEHGMQYSNQPYDMNPAGNMDLGSVADFPGCEFWHAEGGFNTVYSCIEGVSVAHVMGRSIVEAEAFTSKPPLYFNTYPGDMKNQLDWAFAIGINGITFHTFQHQPLGDAYKPGMHMGVHGINWHRNQNWWDMLPAFHTYIARNSHLLRQGTAVADILYLTPEGAPHIFLPPDSAMEGPEMIPDKKGYVFDAVTPRILMERAYVNDGAIAFPGGSHYRLLVLPDTATMTPETLAVVAQLIQEGATVIGNPPIKSPSLVNYPQADQHVSSLALEIWGDLEVPDTETVRSYGEGAIYWGGAWSIAENPAEEDSLYPHYDATAAVLQALGYREDFAESKKALRFIHRQTETEDIYFLSNRTATQQELDCTFRVTGMEPALWHPETGETRPLPQYTVGEDSTTIPLRFAPHESYFVVFSEGTVTPIGDAANFHDLNTFASLDGPWTVSFDPKWGGVGETVFPELIDWRDHEERGIKYYSSTAVYRKTFNSPEGTELHQDIVLDLGSMYEMARIKLNGKELGIVWTAPYQISLGNALKHTDNELVIEVANSWENRILGDKTPPDNDVRTVQWDTGLLDGASYTTGRYTFTTLGTIPDRPLQPSGLIGPVTLKIREGEE